MERTITKRKTLNTGLKNTKKRENVNTFRKCLIIFNVMLGAFAVGAVLTIMNILQTTIVDLNRQIDTLESTIQQTREENDKQITMYQEKITVYENTIRDYELMLDGYDDYMTSIGVHGANSASLKTRVNDTEDKSIVFNPNDVTEISNASPDTINNLLEGTRLEGYGWLYHELEQIYGINAIYAIANSFQEAGYQYNESSSYAARNNIYGLKNKSFPSVDACIAYYFQLISNHYVNERGLKSIDSIGTVYCPDSNLWDDGVVHIGNKLHSNALATQN